MTLAGLAVAAPQAAVVAGSAAAVAALVRAGGRVLDALQGKSIGVYRTSLLPHERFGAGEDEGTAGRHPGRGGAAGPGHVVRIRGDRRLRRQEERHEREAASQRRRGAAAGHPGQRPAARRGGRLGDEQGRAVARPGHAGAQRQGSRARRRRPVQARPRRWRRRGAGDARPAPRSGALEDRRLREDQEAPVRRVRLHRWPELVRLPVRLAARQPRRRPPAGRGGAALARGVPEGPGQGEREARPAGTLDGRPRGPVLHRSAGRVGGDAGAHHVRHAVPRLGQRDRLPGPRLQEGHRAVQGRSVQPAAVVDLGAPAAADLPLRR